MLAGAVEGALWLDLYAGTGAVGLEALSRGARRVCLVEYSKKAAAVIRANLRELGAESGCELLERDVMAALRKLDAQGARFDFCSLAPPYREEKAYGEVLDFLSRSELIAEKSAVIAEHDKHFDPGDAFGPLLRYRTLRQGDAVLSFYRKTLTADSRG